MCCRADPESEAHLWSRLFVLEASPGASHLRCDPETSCTETSGQIRKGDLRKSRKSTLHILLLCSDLLRHACASHLYDHGAPQAIAALLGHAKLSTAQMYTWNYESRDSFRQPGSSPRPM
jgi:integrase